VIRFVNTYLGPLVDVVLDGGGMIERFTGDGLKACFGVPLDDPGHAATAVRCALAMRARMKELGEQHRTDFPIACRIGIGLASGRAVAGCLGNERRLDFTLAGDVTNTGARVESLTKRYATDFLVTEATVVAAGDRFSFRLVDKARLKGKTTPTSLYDIVASERAALTVKYAEAFADYEAGRFARAAASFRALCVEFSDDGPSKTLADRCATFAANPPPAWAGIYDFPDK
jgi:adenylate cyclase